MLKKTIKVNMSELDHTRKTPIFAYCRKLIADGEKVNTRLEVFRNNSTWDVAVNNIGEGARTAVNEDPTPHFVKYIKFKGFD